MVLDGPYVRPIGRWLVPLFLIVVGALLLADGSLLEVNATANYLYLQDLPCQPVNGTYPPCKTLSRCQEECMLADLTGFLGAVTLISGVCMAAVRWNRWRGHRRQT